MLRIEARAHLEGAHLKIIDNGRGFDLARPLRQGLLSMRERAAAIGATLSLESQAGRSVVDILLSGKGA